MRSETERGCDGQVMPVYESCAISCTTDNIHDVRLAFPLVVLLALITSVSRAQTVDPECEATSDTSVLFRKGKEHFAAEAYDKAYYCYKKHWDLQPSYDVAGNLGNLEVTKLGKYADGAAHLQYARDHLPGSLEPATREATLKRIDELLRDALARVGRLRLSVAPEGATVQVDGSVVGKAPLQAPLYLDPGPHTLLLELAGHRREERRVTAVAGAEETLQVTLAPAEGESVPGESGPSTTKLAIGLTGAGVGVAGVVAGIVLLVVSNGAGDDAEALRAQIASDPTAPAQNPCGEGPSPHASCADLREAAEDELTFRNAGIATLVVGGALLVGSVLYLVIPTSDDQEAARVEPTPLGLRVRGRF